MASSPKQLIVLSVILTLIILTVNKVTASDVLSCNQLIKNREFLPAENKELQQLSYQQKVTRSHVHCVSYCHADPQCYSVNYNIDNHLCQLNNATRAQYPHNFITHYGSVYFDADVNTPLLSLPDQLPTTHQSLSPSLSASSSPSPSQSLSQSSSQSLSKSPSKSSSQSPIKS